MQKPHGGRHSKEQCRSGGGNTMEQEKKKLWQEIMEAVYILLVNLMSMNY